MDVLEPETVPQVKGWVRQLLYSRDVGLTALLLVLLVGLYFFAWREMRFFLVPSNSMYPTLSSSDMIITLNQAEYRRGDIVVWREQGEYMVKRIIALPGDTVSIVDGALFLNGKYASEPYIFEAMHYYIERPVAIPDGHFFYLGDNRNASDDSSLGFITAGLPDAQQNPNPYLGNLSAINGKVVFRYFPYDRFGRVRSFPLINVAGQ